MKPKRILLLISLIIPTIASSKYHISRGGQIGGPIIEAQNKAVVNDFFTTFRLKGLKVAFFDKDIVPENVYWWVPAGLPFAAPSDERGYKKSEYVKKVLSNFAGFNPPGMQLFVRHMIAEGDYVAAEVESIGAHSSGFSYNNKYHFLIKLKDGKFVEVKEYMNTLHLYGLTSALGLNNK